MTDGTHEIEANDAEAGRSELTYQQAKKAIALFDSEWIGQDAKMLWAWATEESKKTI